MCIALRTFANIVAFLSLEMTWLEVYHLTYHGRAFLFMMMADEVARFP
jgi:hypothetical protein